MHRSMVPMRAVPLALAQTFAVCSYNQANLGRGRTMCPSLQVRLLDLLHRSALWLECVGLPVDLDDHALH